VGGLVISLPGAATTGLDALTKGTRAVKARRTWSEREYNMSTAAESDQQQDGDRKKGMQRGLST